MWLNLTGSELKLHGVLSRKYCFLSAENAPGQIIYATGRFIQEVICKHKGEQVMSMQWAPTVSKNPFLEFEFDGGAAGDPVELSWKDNKGETASKTVKVK